MNLHAICYYPGNSDAWTGKWNNSEHTALKLVKAVKRIDFNGRATVALGGKDFTFENDQAGRERALYLVGRSLAARIQRAGYSEAAVIPIPSSSHIDPADSFTGRRIADAIQSTHGPFRSAPVLYFSEPIPKARSGGTRNPYYLQPRLRLAAPILPPAVLIDDVFTTGGHMIAAARFLRSRGIEVTDAFVIGRTTRERPEKMFSVAIEQVDTSEIFDF